VIFKVRDSVLREGLFGESFGLGKWTSVEEWFDVQVLGVW
jgi:hypothetical protein